MNAARGKGAGREAIAERPAGERVAELRPGSGVEPELRGSRRAIARATLLGLGLVQAANGTWALFAPSSFYGEFPFGRGWVELLPAYNEHLTTDVGALYLATSALLLGAAWAMERKTVIVACIAWLIFALPHAIYHAFHLEPFGTADAVANALVLAAAVLLPAWVLGTVARPAPARRRRPGTLMRPSACGARIAGVPDNTRNLLARASFRESRRRYGAVMEPVRIFALHPKLLMGYSALEFASERSQLVPARLKHLAELRAGMLCGCEWCLDFGSAISAEAGIGEQELRELPRYRDSDRFTAVEKLVLDYAATVTRTPVEVSDELFAKLTQHFDGPELVELTSIIALENYRARFNWAFGIEGQGFSEGSFCLAPEPRPGVG